jgi:hypothetical protein
MKICPNTKCAQHLGEDVLVCPHCGEQLNTQIKNIDGRVINKIIEEKMVRFYITHAKMMKKKMSYCVYMKLTFESMKDTNSRILHIFEKKRKPKRKT